MIVDGRTTRFQSAFPDSLVRQVRDRVDLGASEAAEVFGISHILVLYWRTGMRRRSAGGLRPHDDYPDRRRRDSKRLKEKKIK